MKKYVFVTYSEEMNKLEVLQWENYDKVIEHLSQLDDGEDTNFLTEDEFTPTYSNEVYAIEKTEKYYALYAILEDVRAGQVYERYDNAEYIRIESVDGKEIKYRRLADDKVYKSNEFSLFANVSHCMDVVANNKRRYRLIKENKNV